MFTRLIVQSCSAVCFGMPTMGIMRWFTEEINSEFHRKGFQIPKGDQGGNFSLWALKKTRNVYADNVPFCCIPLEILFLKNNSKGGKALPNIIFNAVQEIRCYFYELIKGRKLLSLTARGFASLSWKYEILQHHLGKLCKFIEWADRVCMHYINHLFVFECII